MRPTLPTDSVGRYISVKIGEITYAKEIHQEKDEKSTCDR